MRIAHCVLEPRYSGAEVLVLGLVRAHAAAGADNALIALRPADPQFEPELTALANFRCQMFIPPTRLVRQQRLAWIRRAARTFRTDIVFAHSALPSVYSRLGLIGLRGVTTVTVLHTDEDFDNTALRIFERCTWRRSAAIVGVSRASLRNYRRLVTGKADLVLIENGVDFSAIRSFIPQRQEVRSRVYRATSDEVILLQVGRISPQKQQRLSVEALARLGQTMSLDKIRLFFAGVTESEAYRAEVEEIARKLGIANRLEFLGSRGDVAQLLAGADAHLMPSAWEAQGIVAIEALASGVFCVFTDLEAFLPYLGMPGVDILPKDSTSEHLANSLSSALSKALTSRRYDRDLEPYDFKKCARQYLELAERLTVGRTD